jgi:hypothetical protein
VSTFRIIQTLENVSSDVRSSSFLNGPIRVGGRSFDALERFERDGVRLPRMTDGPYLTLDADCPSSGAYCSQHTSLSTTQTCVHQGYGTTPRNACASFSDGLSKLFAKDLSQHYVKTGRQID